MALLLGKAEGLTGNEREWVAHTGLKDGAVGAWGGAWDQEGASEKDLGPKGFPGGANGKEPYCQCRRYERCRFDPWVRKIPWRRAWQPTPVFLSGESHGQRSLAGSGP